MEENQKKKSTGGGFAVGLTVICILGLAIMGYFIYYLLNARKADNEKIQQLHNDIANIRSSVIEINDKVEAEEENEDEEETTSPTTDTKTSNIVLDGIYSLTSPSDVSWEFTKDGKASYATNVFSKEGTYKTIEDGRIEIVYTTEKTFDEETEKSTEVNKESKEYITVKNGKMFLTDSTGNEDEIIKYE